MRARMVLSISVVVMVVGSVGAFRYVQTFWLYRGFPPPTVPKRVAVPGQQGQTVSVQAGHTVVIQVRSPALGGRVEPVYVFLPPGYQANPTRRYPVLYMLHGYPGGPTHMLDALGLSVDEDLLVTVHQLTPLIVVSPTGSPSFIGNDKEWANGIGPGNAWETYLTRDVVQAVDQQFRTIPNGAGRAIAGLSEGAYGALNVGLHHPEEFRVIEAWSGYERAETTQADFGGRPGLIAYNSPLVWLPHVAARLRAAHTYIWFYVGSKDGKLDQNQQFADELTRLGVDHRFFALSGGHNWALWRPHVEQALIVISERLAHG